KDNRREHGRLDRGLALLAELPGLPDDERLDSDAAVVLIERLDQVWNKSLIDEDNDDDEDDEDPAFGDSEAEYKDAVTLGGAMNDQWVREVLNLPPETQLAFVPWTAGQMRRVFAARAELIKIPAEQFLPTYHQRLSQEKDWARQLCKRQAVDLKKLLRGRKA